MMSLKNFSRFFALPSSTSGRLFYCFLCGAMGGAAMGPLYFWLNLLLGSSLYWIILTSMAKQKSWKSFLAGWLFGFGYFLSGIYWIGNALLVEGNPYLWAYPFAAAGLPAAMAFYFAFPALVTRLLHGGRDGRSFAIFCVASMLFEYLRARLFTGFPWNLYGMTWSGNLEMLQFLSVGGIYVLSFLTIFMFLAPAFALCGHSPKKARIAVIAVAVLTGISLYVYGAQRLAAHPTEYREDVVVQLVQPNIPQSEKWDGALMWDNYRKIMNILRRDALLDGKGPSPARLLVLPETAITYHHLSEPSAIEALRGSVAHFNEKTYLLSGALLKDKDGYHNSLIALDTEGRTAYSFDKFHLVPFGEYMPFQKYIPFGPLVDFAGFVEGPGPQTAQIDGVPPFSPLVCYEVIFAGEVTTDNPVRPEWIVNVTNDAWYGVSPGPFQHMAHAVYRAIEEGVPVVRSANTGISAVIDPYGRIVSSIPLMSTYTTEVYLPRPAAQQPLYSELKNF